MRCSMKHRKKKASLSTYGVSIMLSLLVILFSLVSTSGFRLLPTRNSYVQSRTGSSVDGNRNNRDVALLSEEKYVTSSSQTVSSSLLESIRKNDMKERKKNQKRLLFKIAIPRKVHRKNKLANIPIDGKDKREPNTYIDAGALTESQRRIQKGQERRRRMLQHRNKQDRPQKNVKYDTIDSEKVRREINNRRWPGSRLFNRHHNSSFPTDDVEVSFPTNPSLSGDYISSSETSSPTYIAETRTKSSTSANQKDVIRNSTMQIKEDGEVLSPVHHEIPSGTDYHTVRSKVEIEGGEMPHGNNDVCFDVDEEFELSFHDDELNSTEKLPQIPLEGPSNSRKERKASRVTFKAKHETQRKIPLYRYPSTNGTYGSDNGNEKMRQLFIKYMTQPIEQYGLMSFNDDGERFDNAEVDCSQNITRTRRWIVRKLRPEEEAPYNTQHRPENFKGVNILSDSNSTGEKFRLAVPLTFSNLTRTPVTDLEIYRVSHNDIIAACQPLCPWKKRRDTRNHEIKVRSLKVALLSNDNEVEKLMEDSTGIYEGPHFEATVDGSQDTVEQSVKQWVQRYNKKSKLIQDWIQRIQPHIEFQGTISWDDGGESTSKAFHKAENSRDDKKDSVASIKITGSAVASLTLPPQVPANCRFAAKLITRGLGHICLEFVLEKALPQFLNQVEKDFRRWSDLAENRSDENGEQTEVNF